LLSTNLSVSSVFAGLENSIMESSKKAETSAEATKKRLRSKAVCFGRDYFHVTGGASKVQVETMTKFVWNEPPWQGKEGDEISQTACTAQSTIFLTEQGKIYQTGTMHGRVYKETVPIVVPLPLKCVEIAAGRHFCLGRMEGGLATVSWGAGHFGQLGVGGNDLNSGEGQITFTPQPIVIEVRSMHDA
jgi:alpha-tubulin suppressor-like RCC1 family protein